MSSRVFRMQILDRPAVLEVSCQGSREHVFLTVDDLTITDASGYCGFWDGFNAKRLGALKGAAHWAALQKYAQEFSEREVLAHIQQHLRELS